MKVTIRDIRPEGLDIRGEIALDIFEYSPADTVRFVMPLQVMAHLQKTPGHVLANANVSSQYTILCGRCLEPLQRDWQRNFHFDFEIDPAVEFVDLGEEVRQDAIVDLPTKALCSENCLGICPGCGANLNKEGCCCRERRNTQKKDAK